MVERFGNFTRQAGAGPNVICCPVEMMVGKVSLRVQQLEVRCETKTLDNVFVDIIVSIQYQVLQERVFEAFYSLMNPHQQITSYVYDVVRSTLPTMNLDHAYEAKEDIAMAIKTQLGKVMQEYGYLILNALVVDMNPDSRVRAAMNEINASKRLKEAAFEKAEGEKIILVKSAEAEAESKYLSGVGVARQRKAIVDGLRDSLAQFSSGVKGSTPKDVIDLLLLTQYFDMLKDVGQQAGTRAVFLPAKGKSQVGAVRDGLLQATAGARNIA
jgi:regulator of protease activity HflC (stomatin/prohibitin superfamily)